MAHNLLTATFDAATELHDAAAAVTADGAGQVGGTARVVNVGLGLLQAVLVVDISALTTGGAAPETYDLILEGSSDPAFGSNVVECARVSAGGTTGNGVGRVTRPFINAKDGETPLAYLRIRADVGGTAPSVVYRAWITKNPTA